MDEFLAIVPVRKPWLEFGGLKYLGHCLDVACSSKSLSRVVVWASDEAVSEVCRSRNVDVVHHIEEVKEDTLESIVNRVLERQPARYLVILEPITPLRAVEDIDGAVELFLRKKVGTVLSVCEAEHHPFKLLQPQGEGVLPAFDWSSLLKTEVPPYLRWNESLIVLGAEEFRIKGTLFPSPVRPFLMPEERSLSVRTPFEDRLCQWLLAGEPSV